MSALTHGFSRNIGNYTSRMLPCPFCGSSKIGYYTRKVPFSWPEEEWAVGFRCLSCHCSTGRKKGTDGLEYLVDLWNKAKR